MRILFLVAVSVLALSVCASASFIPGANNEVINGGFENGLTNWQFVDGQVCISDFSHSGNAAVQCNENTEGWGDRIRQVIDDSTSVYWDWNLHAKVVDLEAYISIDVKGQQNGGVRFRLDWWDETYNSYERPPSETVPGYHVTEWVTYLKSDGYGTSYKYVNPFNNFQIRDDAGKPWQPRWISVEVEFLQPNNVINRVDDIVLTSKCVPEPGSLLALATGVIGLAGLRLRKRS